ncbi:MAG: aspartate--ammonia ligase [Bradymonadales bacterium]|jgi:aspartate--ammonia ligase
MPEKYYQLPYDYEPLLDLRQTQVAIKFVKDAFERELAQALNLSRVTAPLFVTPSSGLNDELSGVERPVSFAAASCSEELEIVHSLAKWKRMALARYGFTAGEGLYTDMNAIRRDEYCDSLHSIYVDQWDWERVMLEDERNFAYLLDTVERIYAAIKSIEWLVRSRFPVIKPSLPDNIFFITSQDLLNRYPDKTPKQREATIAETYGAVFIIGIGGKLSNNEPHDLRAPDYDDWTLNGDIILWNDVLNCAFELSSMGIRVDPPALRRQLDLVNGKSRENLPFHKSLLQGELPLTIGGGIGQSRLCMQLLKKAHIGEVQVSHWPKRVLEECQSYGIELL